MMKSFAAIGMVSMLSSSFGATTPFQTAFTQPMMKVYSNVEDKYSITPIFTIGETLPSDRFASSEYTPAGIPDGMGAWKPDSSTVRIYFNHELATATGYSYSVCADEACSSTFSLTGSRISFLDIDIESLQVKNSGIAYNKIIDGNGVLYSDNTEFVGDGAPEKEPGFQRFCSAQFLFDNEYGVNRGVVDKIFFSNEEVGFGDDTVGGAYWALDVQRERFYHAPWLGRGAWESLTQIDTGTTEYIALILADDTSPEDDATEGQLASPLYLYVGQKSGEQFMERNGLVGGKMYVWVPDDLALNSPETFHGTGNAQAGQFVEVDNSPQLSNASIDGSSGFDRDGFPTQRNLWIQAKQKGAFKITRPEDMSTYSTKPDQFVLVSTGRGGVFNDADTLGTIYTMEVKFDENGVPKPSILVVLLDANSDETNQRLRSPDNLDWAEDGKIYIQEDRAFNPAFLSGPNTNEAQIVVVDPNAKNTNQELVQVAFVDRTATLDPSRALGKVTLDVQAGSNGAWESSGILEVSTLFNKPKGSLFVFGVQAHGLRNQGVGSRLISDDLVEGGQLLFLQVLAPLPTSTPAPTVSNDDTDNEGEGSSPAPAEDNGRQLGDVALIIAVVLPSLVTIAALAVLFKVSKRLDTSPVVSESETDALIQRTTKKTAIKRENESLNPVAHNL